MADGTDQVQAPPPSARPFRGAGSVALRITLLYALTAGLWIVSTDFLLHHVALALGLSSDAEQVLQTLKGWLYVVVTAILLFVAIRAYLRAFETTQAALNRRIEAIAAQYQHLFARNPFPMWIYDPQTLRILTANDRTLETYGYTRRQLEGLDVRELHDPAEAARLADLTCSPEQTPRFAGVWKQRTRDGRTIEAEVVGHWIDFDGRRARLVMSIDVTERLRAQRALEEYRVSLERRVAERTAALSAANDRLRADAEERQRAEEQLRAAKESAERASEAKSVYLANTTHEIRTPLTSILGYVDLLMDDALPERQRRRYLEVVQQNAGHLLKLVDDLLDLTRAEMGKMMLTLETESTRDMAAQAIELVRPKAAEKNLELVLEIARNAPSLIHTDGVRLRQILLNLLANAIKFTPTGRVSLVVEAAGQSGAAPPGADPTADPTADPAAHHVRFNISDTGIGIGAEFTRRIFEPFFQVDHGPSRRYRGFGLGLAISRELVERLGGAIRVTSMPGVGSTFSVELPVKIDGAAPLRAASRDAASERLQARVLLAEDDANIRWLVEEYLRRAGAQVVSLSDGASAVAQVQNELAQGPGPGLVLIDIHMPAMDGIEVMRRLRSMGYRGPIVALTAHPQAEDRERWRAAGCDAVAGKPIDRATFIPMLARLLSEHPAIG
ncbi:MAG TPA: ATP-binding protein [Phycisphaerae bacterium]|nr:ATP-binding protein [Phycisphaerae bacterium]